MATISSIGIGSGIDIETLITQLLAVEKNPQTALLSKKEASVSAKLTGLGSLKSALKAFETSLTTYKSDATFNKRTATSADTSKFTVTSDSTAVSGSYDVEVVQLGVAQKLISSAFDSPATVVGTGTLTIATEDASQSFTITINSANDTLAEIRDTINNASDNFGVSATIVNVDDGAGGFDSKLVISAIGVGTDNELRITADDDDLNDVNTSGLSRLVYNSPTTTNLTELQAAKDAIIKVDQQTMTNKSDNRFVDAVTGVTIVAVAQDPGNTDKLSVTLDNSGVSKQVANFVKDYNSLIETLNSLGSFDSETGATGLLFADSSLRFLKNSIISAVSSTVAGVTGTFSSLSEVGVNLDENNKLVITQAELDSALSEDFDNISALFTTDTTGIAAQLAGLIDDYTISTTGIIDKKSSGLDDILDTIADDRTRLNASMAKKEEVLRAKFIAMDTILAQLELQSNFISQQFEAFNNSNNN